MLCRWKSEQAFKKWMNSVNYPRGVFPPPDEYMSMEIGGRTAQYSVPNSVNYQRGLFLRPDEYRPMEMEERTTQYAVPNSAYYRHGMLRPPDEYRPMETGERTVRYTVPNMSVGPTNAVTENPSVNYRRGMFPPPDEYMSMEMEGGTAKYDVPNMSVGPTSAVREQSRVNYQRAMFLPPDEYRPMEMEERTAQHAVRNSVNYQHGIFPSQYEYRPMEIGRRNSQYDVPYTSVGPANAVSGQFARDKFRRPPPSYEEAMRNRVSSMPNQNNSNNSQVKTIICPLCGALERNWQLMNVITESLLEAERAETNVGPSQVTEVPKMSMPNAIDAPLQDGSDCERVTEMYSSTQRQNNNDEQQRQVEEPPRLQCETDNHFNRVATEVNIQRSTTIAREGSTGIPEMMTQPNCSFTKVHSDISSSLNAGCTVLSTTSSSNERNSVSYEEKLNDELIRSEYEAERIFACKAEAELQSNNQRNSQQSAVGFPAENLETSTTFIQPEETKDNSHVLHTRRDDQPLDENRIQNYERNVIIPPQVCTHEETKGSRNNLQNKTSQQQVPQSDLRRLFQRPINLETTGSCKSSNRNSNPRHAHALINIPPKPISLEKSERRIPLRNPNPYQHQSDVSNSPDSPFYKNIQESPVGSYDTCNETLHPPLAQSAESIRPNPDLHGQIKDIYSNIQCPNSVTSTIKQLETTGTTGNSNYVTNLNSCPPLVPPGFSVCQQNAFFGNNSINTTSNDFQNLAGPLSAVNNQTQPVWQTEIETGNCNIFSTTPQIAQSQLVSGNPTIHALNEENIRIGKSNVNSCNLIRHEQKTFDSSTQASCNTLQQVPSWSNYEDKLSSSRNKTKHESWMFHNLSNFSDRTTKKTAGSSKGKVLFKNPPLNKRSLRGRRKQRRDTPYTCTSSKYSETNPTDSYENSIGLIDAFSEHSANNTCTRTAPSCTVTCGSPISQVNKQLTEFDVHDIKEYDTASTSGVQELTTTIVPIRNDDNQYEMEMEAFDTPVRNDVLECPTTTYPDVTGPQNIDSILSELTQKSDIPNSQTDGITDKGMVDSNLTMYDSIVQDVFSVHDKQIDCTVEAPVVRESTTTDLSNIIEQSQEEEELDEQEIDFTMEDINAYEFDLNLF